MKRYVLLTGGSGYIGSHTAVSLINHGYDVVILDNLSNSDKTVINKIEKITGVSVPFYQIDIRDHDGLENLFTKYRFDAVLHFAGLKSVEESTKAPIKYYENNVCGTVNILKVMDNHEVKKIVFSSSATVYGVQEKMPITEDAPIAPYNPYGRSKYFVEEILHDQSSADRRFSVAILRYFNPVGAHESGLIGENPIGEPNNLMPYIAQVASGNRKVLNIFGADYPTKDGTGVRDYIHVVDLAEGHVLALDYLFDHTGLYIWNLGAGQGYSVRGMVQAFERACGCHVPYKICPRRPGDVAVCYADVSKAKKELDWQAKKSLNEMCEDSWRWEINRQKNNDSI